MMHGTKKSKSNSTLRVTLVVSLLIIIVAVVGAFAAYYIVDHKHNTVVIPPLKSKAGHVDASDAKDQVENFYRQYISTNSADFRTVLVRGYGSKNLVFYSEYYQHGFDPLVCSTAMPIKVSAVRAVSAAEATVNVVEEYADHSTNKLVATVVVNNEGLKIDSVTCSGNKGGLLPAQ